MQILYIARERLDAQAAAAALQDIAPSVEVLWAGRFDEATAWIDEHRDVTALLVDAQVDGQDCGAFLTDLRGQGISAPVVVIAPDPADPFRAGADDAAENIDSGSGALPAALTRAMELARTLGPGRWDHLRVEAPPSALHSIDMNTRRSSSIEAASDPLAKCQADVEATISLLFPEANDSCVMLANRLADLDTAFVAAHEQAERELADCRSRFEVELSQAAAERERLEQKLCDADLALDALRREQAWAVAENERLTQRAAELAGQLDERRVLMLRQFEESALAMCRCTRGGTLMHANRAFVQLIGIDSVDAILSADFGRTVFESPDDLRWLIERSAGAASKVTIETTWKTKDGSRLIVRLSAWAPAPDAIEIVAEDLTNLRSLQDSLGRAQRMEAVGRLASEVAVTCANLLGDVHQDAQKWLRTVGTDTSLRHQGEMLLDEVTRASGFLRQLAAYGDEQTSALGPVDLNKVLRDLGPVLKRVAGDEVELELPRTPTPLIVDVQLDRVERLLVNLAGYGRERMPFGGRLRIELSTVTVDQAFIEKYPNVRQGPHALITVTETRRTGRAEGPLGLREWPEPTGVDRKSPGSLGVDLGALQGLIRECCGHLWVTAVPRGDMEVQIRLPLRSTDSQNQPRPPIPRTSLSLIDSSLVRH